ncbi:MAG: NifU family protein [Bacteriovoracaceae bacterium]|jgi:Fe-S cluster biogenesis protein NfuA
MIAQLEKLFDTQVRPALAQHGGNVEIVDVDNNILFIKMMGGCHGCSSSKITVKGGIDQLVKQNFPEIVDIVDVTDHETGTNPYM